MLIICTECGHNVSDRALACPNCGFPVSELLPGPADKKRRAGGTAKRHMKLPNGFGSIKKLSGKRRRPYAAYPPVTEWKLNGSPVSVPAVGYYESYNDAYAALLDFNRKGIPVGMTKITFTGLFEMFWKEEIESKGAKSSKRNSYRAAYRKCAKLYDKEFATLRKPDYQEILDDNAGMSLSSLTNIKLLFGQLAKIAIENDIIDRNYAANVTIDNKDVESGVPFTLDEIKLLWKHSADPRAQKALILTYSGFRIQELKKTKINLPRNCFEGGLKTAFGKTRIVPIHSGIRTFVENFDQDAFIPAKYRTEEFAPLLESLGISHAATGERHTPHDCRHTFSWLADKYKMDTVSKHLIMGHVLGNDVETAVYSHRTFDELYAELNKIQSFAQN